MKNALHNKQSWSGVFINRKRNNEYWHSSITVTPILIGEETYYVGVFRELDQLDAGAHYERKIIEMHPILGVDILNKISKDIDMEFINKLDVAINIINYHHEKWDGSGYPYKLKGKNIPLEARIVAIVDVYDALISRRPYKDPWSKKEALTYIKEQKGKHFDPDIVDSFINMITKDEPHLLCMNNL